MCVQSDGLTFYRCPLAAACLPGVNGSRAMCATGYQGVLCTVCAPGYFTQYGLCSECKRPLCAIVSAATAFSLMLAPFVEVGCVMLTLLTLQF